MGLNGGVVFVGIHDHRAAAFPDDPGGSLTHRTHIRQMKDLGAGNGFFRQILRRQGAAGAEPPDNGPAASAPLRQNDAVIGVLPGVGPDSGGVHPLKFQVLPAEGPVQVVPRHSQQLGPDPQSPQNGKGVGYPAAALAAVPQGVDELVGAREFFDLQNLIDTDGADSDNVHCGSFRLTGP